ncbi:alpha/beta hydrolase [Companilactobacillus musae]|uniref:alpha/beta fold hydrolase n=1 Tax=Companilactobacillus musae TaxID=1903258 RepID=UPI000E65DCF7|nr:alpha/beta hydrolase [Companilactobacillus musae]
MEFLTSDGIEINYQDYGQGQSIVLIEGFGGYQEIWQAQVDYLKNMNCRVITYDHRNHGRSQRTNLGLTIERLTKDLAELIDYLNLKDPILVGHSMGASIVYSYLSRYKNLKSVMAIDQSPKMLNNSSWSYGFEDITVNDFKEKVIDSSKVHETLHGLDSKVALSLNRVKNEYPFERQKNLELLYDHIGKDWRKALISSQIPVSFVVARQSPYFDYHFPERLLVNKKLNSIILDNCGHDIMAEIPNQFNQTLRHFIYSSLRK